jgi:acetyl-CoA decarbonylase/synthase complex subunit delta
MIVDPGAEALKVKESKVGEGVPESWGDWNQRANNWELLTATTLIHSGANIVVLRHPENLSQVHKVIADLMTASATT